jgi:hypothetical protein
MTRIRKSQRSQRLVPLWESAVALNGRDKMLMLSSVKEAIDP